MKESRMWKNLSPHLPPTFTRITDRFQLGFPDVVGCHKKRAYAFELKQSDRATKVQVTYRPNQVYILREWEAHGAAAFTVVSLHRRVFIFKMKDAEDLEDGLEIKEAERRAICVSFKWPEIARGILRG